MNTEANQRLARAFEIGQEIERKRWRKAAAIFFAAVAIFFFVRGLHAQTQSAPLRTSQLNRTLFVGQVGFPTIQSAVTKACNGGAGGWQVNIPPGAQPADTVGAVTGCPSVYITDDRTATILRYQWQNNAYTQIAIGGSGGGGAAGPQYAIQYSSGGATPTSQASAATVDAAGNVSTPAQLSAGMVAAGSTGRAKLGDVGNSYQGLTLNGTFADGGTLGLSGGNPSDPNLYVNAQDAMNFRLWNGGTYRVDGDGFKSNARNGNQHIGPEGISVGTNDPGTDTGANGALVVDTHGMALVYAKTEGGGRSLAGFFLENTNGPYNGRTALSFLDPNDLSYNIALGSENADVSDPSRVQMKCSQDNSGCSFPHGVKGLSTSLLNPVFQSYNTRSTTTYAGTTDDYVRQGLGPYGFNSSVITTNVFGGNLSTFDNLASSGASTDSVSNSYQNSYGYMQHVMHNDTLNCYGDGDCIFDGRYMNLFGGGHQNAGEGAHPFDVKLTEGPQVARGTVASIGGTNNTILNLTNTAEIDTMGVGRYAADMSKSVAGPDVITGGGAAPGVGNALTMHFSTASRTPDAFFMVAAAAPSAAPLPEPGTIAATIQTSGFPGYFQSNLSGIPASGVGCAFSQQTAAYFEQVPYNVTSPTTFTTTLRKIKDVNWIFFVGPNCGKGLDLDADQTTPPGRVTKHHIDPLFGCMDSSTCLTDKALVDFYNSGNSAFSFGLMTVGNIACDGAGNGTLSGRQYLNTGPPPFWFNGRTVTITSATAPSITSATLHLNNSSSDQFTFACSGPAATGTDGTISFNNGTYHILPQAELVSVLDPNPGDPNIRNTRYAVDGLNIGLEPNAAGFTAGDTIQVHTSPYLTTGGADPVYEATYSPQTIYSGEGLGVVYGGPGQPAPRSAVGWRSQNNGDDALYAGLGGTHILPQAGMQVLGAWAYDQQLEVTAFHVGTQFNLHDGPAQRACYYPWEFNAAGDSDFFVQFCPLTATLDFGTVTPAASSMRAGQFVNTTGEVVTPYADHPQFSGVALRNRMTLTGNIAAWTLPNGTYGGQPMTLEFCQDGTGGRTVPAPPANVNATVLWTDPSFTSAGKCGNYHLEWSPAAAAWQPISSRFGY